MSQSGQETSKAWAANCTPVLARIRPARVRKASHQAKLQRMRRQIAGLGSLSADRRRGGVKTSSPPPHIPLPHTSWPMKRERGSHVGPERFRAWQNVNEKEERDSKVPPTPRSVRERARFASDSPRAPRERERRGTERRQAGRPFWGRVSGRIGSQLRATRPDVSLPQPGRPNFDPLLPSPGSPLLPPLPPPPPPLPVVLVPG